MELELQDRVAVVTGASRGIGLAVAQTLLRAGARVYAGARRSAPELAADGLTMVQVDLARPEGPAELIAAAGNRIDVLVNNVGAAPARTNGFLSVTDNDWLETLNLNLLTAVRATRAALPAMLAAGRGSIVNVCSVNAVLSDPAVIDYSAAKAALASFSKALSKEVGARGIRVNTVSPGPVATALWLGEGGVAETVAGATGTDAATVAQKAAHEMLTGRFSRPDEVAELVVLLASDRTANVTGSDFRIDGGLVPVW
ncbi:oxidoreductase [Dactylosporangium salmoneum]|uniref:SDR family oxidoreductase n=1 Tax=Dactylosporangium salmoneum TaxID=53361 RepID=A0ABP5TTR9_9ACTN